MKNPYLGYQKTIDFYDCDTHIINDCDIIETTLLEAAKIMELTVVNTTIHSFSPIGVSGVIVIKESHIAIHTWPEHGYVAIDIFTCSPDHTLDNGISFLQERFKASRISQKEILRGNLNQIKNIKPVNNEF